MELTLHGYPQISVLDRPITQQGLSGMKTGYRGPQRQVSPWSQSSFISPNTSLYMPPLYIHSQSHLSLLP